MNIQHFKLEIQCNSLHNNYLSGYTEAKMKGGLRLIPKIPIDKYLIVLY